MTFVETVKKVGYEIALAIFQNIHGKDFSNDFSFEKWVEVLEAARREGAAYLPRTLGRSKLLPLARTYYQWDTIFRRFPYDKEQVDEKIAAMNEMFTTASTIDECFDLDDVLSEMQNHFSIYGLTMTQRAYDFNVSLVQKVARLSSTFEHWSWVYGKVATDEGELKNTSVTQMDKLATNFDEWFRVYKVSQGCFPDIEKHAFEQMVALAK